MTDYENLKNEKPHITAQIKKECGVGIAFTVLSALDIQECQINKLTWVLENLHLRAASISDMVPRIGKERSDYKKFQEAMKETEKALGFDFENK